MPRIVSVGPGRVPPSGPRRPAGADPARAAAPPGSGQAQPGNGREDQDCLNLTTGSAAGRWATRVRLTSISAGSRSIRASRTGVEHCGRAYQAQLPRGHRRPPPPLPFGGPSAFAKRAAGLNSAPLSRRFAGDGRSSLLLSPRRLCAVFRCLAGSALARAGLTPLHAQPAGFTAASPQHRQLDDDWPIS